MSEPIITSSYLCHRCYRPDVEQIPQSDGQNDDDTLVPVGLDEHDDDGATITQVDSSVMFQKISLSTTWRAAHNLT
jgi:hypothetical protein